MIKTSNLLLCAAAALALVACGDDGGGSASGSGGGGGNPSGTGGNPSGTGGDDAASSSANSVSASNSASSSVSASNSGVVSSASVGPVTASSSSGGEGGNGEGGNGEGGNGEGGNGEGGNGEGGNGEGGAPPLECELTPFMDGFFTDPDANQCAQDNCCEELQGCGDPEAGDMSCFNQNGEFDTSLPAAGDLESCVNSAGCFGAVICDSGIGFGDDPEPELLELTICLSDACCQEFRDCMDEDADLCIACLNNDTGDTEICTQADACSRDNCGSGFLFFEVCDSGLGFGDPDQAACTEEFCCDDYAECVGDGSEEETEECLDCLIEGGGNLCDGVIACEEANCSTAICDSGLVIGDIDQAACLTENCCQEHTDCVGDGSEEDLEACIECFIAEGGPLCDDAIDCTEELCPEEPR
jgi:hypothetical protein